MIGAPPATAGTSGLDAVAVRVRERIVHLCAGPEGGHLGGSMSLVEILLSLYQRVMRVDPGRPDLPDRDLLVLSKGHGAVGLYAVLAELGFLPAQRLADYGVAGSTLLAHPTTDVPGVEVASGSLGHGLSIGVGMALAQRLDRTDRRCFVVLGDGELQEGSVWEAATVAAGQELAGLTAVVDHNGLQLSGSTRQVVGSVPVADRWSGFGWTVREVDGHDVDALSEVLSASPEHGRPTAVIARTVKGKGVSYVENQPRSHFARLGPREQQRALRAVRAGDVGCDA